jgi:cephalosporin hydroxylase
VLEQTLDSAKDYVSVDDVVDLVLRIAREGRQRVYNVASSANVTHGEIVDCLQATTGCAVEVRPPRRARGLSADRHRPGHRGVRLPVRSPARRPPRRGGALRAGSPGPRMITIDTAAGIVTVTGEGGSRTLRFDDPEAFEIVSKAWLRVGWNVKHVYGFTWLGRPIIQLPEDVIRLQEVLFTVQPDVIVETGVAHGGGVIFFASLCKLLGRGRVIGVEIAFRATNRAAIEAHSLASYVTLIEGDSTDPRVLDGVRARIGPTDRVFVTLDSSHRKKHVLAELEAYAPLVSPGSYVVVMDGIMEDLVGAPRTDPDWAWNNPRRAAREFVDKHPDFVIEQPPFLFNEGSVRTPVTYWPAGYVKRLR